MFPGEGMHQRAVSPRRQPERDQRVWRQHHDATPRLALPLAVPRRGRRDSARDAADLQRGDAAAVPRARLEPAARSPQELEAIRHNLQLKDIRLGVHPPPESAAVDRGARRRRPEHDPTERASRRARRRCRPADVRDQVHGRLLPRPRAIHPRALRERRRLRHPDRVPAHARPASARELHGGRVRQPRRRVRERRAQHAHPGTTEGDERDAEVAASAVSSRHLRRRRLETRSTLPQAAAAQYADHVSA